MTGSSFSIKFRQTVKGQDFLLFEVSRSHSLRHITFGRLHLNEWWARCRRLRSLIRSLRSDCDIKWGTISSGKSGSTLEHEGQISTSGEVMVGCSSCRVRCWGVLETGRESSCSSGLRFGIMAVYYCEKICNRSADPSVLSTSWGLQKALIAECHSANHVNMTNIPCNMNVVPSLCSDSKT